VKYFIIHKRNSQFELCTSQSQIASLFLVLRPDYRAGSACLANGGLWWLLQSEDEKEKAEELEVLAELEVNEFPVLILLRTSWQASAFLLAATEPLQRTVKVQG
jgi:hypothetical protein